MKGNYIGGIIPLGYKVEDKKYVINEETAPIIKYAFEQYAAGIPKKQIIDELTTKGVRNNNGKPFGRTAFHKALKNKKYIGIIEWNDIVVENACPALIDVETFDRVQERLVTNKKEGGTRKARMKYLLYGKLFCGMCGERMTGECGHGRHGNTFYYYSCHNRKKNKSCAKLNEKKDYLEWYIVEQTLEYVLDPNRIEIIAEAVVAENDRLSEADKIRGVERQVSKVERDLKRAFELLMTSQLKSVIKNAEERIAELEIQKHDLELDLSKLRNSAHLHFTKEQIIALLKSYCKGDLFDLAFRERIIDAFISSVYLHDDKTYIFYNLKNGKQVSFIDVIENEPSEDNPNYTDNEDDKGVRILNSMLQKTESLETLGF